MLFIHCVGDIEELFVLLYRRNAVHEAHREPQSVLSRSTLNQAFSEAKNHVQGSYVQKITSTRFLNFLLPGSVSSNSQFINCIKRLKSLRLMRKERHEIST